MAPKKNHLQFTVCGKNKINKNDSDFYNLSVMIICLLSSHAVISSLNKQTHEAFLTFCSCSTLQISKRTIRLFIRTTCKTYSVTELWVCFITSNIRSFVMTTMEIYETMELKSLNLFFYNLYMSVSYFIVNFFKLIKQLTCT